MFCPFALPSWNVLPFRHTHTDIVRHDQTMLNSALQPPEASHSAVLLLKQGRNTDYKTLYAHISIYIYTHPNSALSGEYTNKTTICELKQMNYLLAFCFYLVIKKRHKSNIKIRIYIKYYSEYNYKL